MDQSRLDELTRFIARRTGRRNVAVGALGGLLATILPGPIMPGARARKKPKNVVCKKPKRRCGKKCVNVKSSRRHCGKCSRTCRLPRVCRQGKCVLPCGKGGRCFAFLTSSAHSANLGGLAGGDSICNQRARAAGLPGRYKAWLSDSVSSPATRFTHNPGPYVLPNGARIANNWADLIDNNLLVPLNIMENGQFQAGMTNVWTGTNSSGTTASYHCSDWTSVVAFAGVYGRADAVNSGWSVAGALNCTSSYRLYCFQQS